METTIGRLLAEQVLAFRKGYVSVTFPGNAKLVSIITSSRKRFSSRAERYVNKLTEHVIKALRRRVTDSLDPEELVTETRSVLDSFKHRTDFIEDVEIRKARQWGQVQAWKDMGAAELFSVSGNPLTQCDECKSRTVTTLDTLSLADIPPYHANCNCSLTDTAPVEITIENSFKDQELTPSVTVAPGDPVDKPLPDTGNVTSCPKCGKTAIENKEIPDHYFCRACGNGFELKDEDDEVEDRTKSRLGPRSKQSQFKKCVQKAKSRLRSQHPDWDEGKIEIQAETACDHLLQMDKKNHN
jgi:hypothetical protein